MSHMKDFMMWLDDRGIAKWDAVIGELIMPAGTNLITSELMDEYRNDAKWHDCETDDKIEEDEWPIWPCHLHEDEWPIDGADMGDSCEWSPTEHWIDANGGLTADAHQLLYEQDSKGDLV